MKMRISPGLNENDPPSKFRKITPNIPRRIPNTSNLVGCSMPVTNETTRIKKGAVAKIIPIFDTLVMFNPYKAKTICRNIPKKETFATSIICS